MNLKDMDCTTMSYLLGVILIGVGLLVILTRQFSLRSGTTIGRRQRFEGGMGGREKYKYTPSAYLEGTQAVVFGIFLLALGVYLLLQPGPWLASVKVCTPP